MSGVRSQNQAGFEALLMGLQAATGLGLSHVRAQGSHEILDMVRWTCLAHTAWCCVAAWVLVVGKKHDQSRSSINAALVSQSVPIELEACQEHEAAQNTDPSHLSWPHGCD